MRLQVSNKETEAERHCLPENRAGVRVYIQALFITACCPGSLSNSLTPYPTRWPFPVESELDKRMPDPLSASREWLQRTQLDPPKQIRLHQKPQISQASLPPCTLWSSQEQLLISPWLVVLYCCLQNKPKTAPKAEHSPPRGQAGDHGHPWTVDDNVQGYNIGTSSCGRKEVSP